MNRLLEIYHQNIPEYLQDFANTPAMLRLREVGMNCGCEYTRFPGFANLRPYSRFDHSLGVALIVWHFTESREQALAGLFHDVTTPVFAHVVDFLNGDHLRQESTEAGTAKLLASSPEVCRLLERHNIALEAVADYHRYPVADNDAPALAADRLEYTLGNLWNYGFADLDRIRKLYDDLIVAPNESGIPELTFRGRDTAAEFALLALEMSRIYVADEDRFSMEALARLLRRAMERGVLTRDDLMTTEPQVIGKLESDPVCAVAWQQFCKYSRILRSREEAEGWIRVDAKKRWIDPMALGHGRVSRWSEVIGAEMKAFQTLDFSHWLWAE